MTRDEIVAAIAAAETTAETLRRMLAEMDKTPPPSAAAPTRWINTSQAAKISRRSYSWLYATASKYGFGFRLPCGSWQFDQIALIAFLSGVASAQESEDCEQSEAAAIHSSLVILEIKSGNEDHYESRSP